MTQEEIIHLFAMLARLHEDGHVTEYELALLLKYLFGSLK